MHTHKLERLHGRCSLSGTKAARHPSHAYYASIAVQGPGQCVRSEDGAANGAERAAGHAGVSVTAACSRRGAGMRGLLAQRAHHIHQLTRRRPGASRRSMLQSGGVTSSSSFGAMLHWGLLHHPWLCLSAAGAIASASHYSPAHSTRTGCQRRGLWEEVRQAMLLGSLRPAQGEGSERTVRTVAAGAAGGGTPISAGGGRPAASSPNANCAGAASGGASGPGEAPQAIAATCSASWVQVTAPLWPCKRPLGRNSRARLRSCRAPNAPNAPRTSLRCCRAGRGRLRR